jgi:hypothetical protein
MLLCHQRSGSNALAAMLRKTEGLFLYGQLFNPFLNYWKRNRRFGVGRYKAHPEAMLHFGERPPLRTRLERAFVSVTPRSTQLDAYMDRFWERCDHHGDWKATGFKAHDFHLTDRELAKVAVEHVGGTVVLSRHNLLRAAVSWAYAKKTDVWSRAGAPDAPPPVYRLDPRDIEWFMKKTRHEVENWRRVLNDAGANTIELFYEDHVATRDLEEAYHFLHLPWNGSPDFGTKKLAGKRYAHIANAEELDRLFSSEENGRLLT